MDFIEGVDDVPEKVTLDWNKNMYGDRMIDFLLSCVLNGRKGICTKDDYTSHILPHHSLLTWKLTLVWPGDSILTSENKTTQFTQCSRMQRLKNAEISQSNVDGLYGEFCDQIKKEMKCELDYKTVTISHVLSNKRRSPGGLIS